MKIPHILSNCFDGEDINMTTDSKGGILISEFGYARPIWIYNVSRNEIGHNQKKAKELVDLSE